MPNEELRDVTKTVEKKLGLYIHAGVYVLVNAILATVNLATNPDHLWFQWPLLGWGAGLALHAALALGTLKGGSLKARMIEKEMKKREKQHQS